jgi:hypothetical protein
MRCAPRPKLGDDNFLRNALRWTFPRAYHAGWSGLQAFLLHHRRAQRTTAVIRREGWGGWWCSTYPRPVSFAMPPGLTNFSIHRLPLAGYKAGLHTLPAKR